MNRKSLTIASLLVILTMAGVSLAVGLSLPDDVRLPIHWDLSGTADQHASKWPALFMPIGVAIFVALLFRLLPALEPRRENLGKSQGLYLWGWAAVLMMAAGIHLVVVAVALGWDIRVNHAVVGLMGAMFVIIGNQLGKSRSMYLVGIRTPWTLASEEVWVKTHRLGGKLMVLAGLAAVAAALLPTSPELLGAVLIGGIGLAALVPIVYSYFAWRAERNRAQPSE